MIELGCFCSVARHKARLALTAIESPAQSCSTASLALINTAACQGVIRASLIVPLFSFFPINAHDQYDSDRSQSFVCGI